MELLQIPFPNIDPNLVRLGPLTIKWYGVSFIAAFLVGYSILNRLRAEGRLSLDKSGISDLVTALGLGVVIGGRLGYAIFYDPQRFLRDPVEIFRIWTGGLAFHGGLVGAVVAMALFARKRGESFVRIGDAVAVGTCPGIFFVRCANFVNAELYGRPTSVPWAMIFPRSDGQPRHPSQLYEGVLEGLFLFAVLWILRRRPSFQPAGRLGGAFLLGYALIRFSLEFVREPDRQLGTVLGPFTMGQILSSAMILGGAFVLFWSRRNPSLPGNAQTQQ